MDRDRTLSFVFASLIIPVVFGTVGLFLNSEFGHMIGVLAGSPFAIAAGYAYDHRTKLRALAERVPEKLNALTNLEFDFETQPAGVWPTVRDPSDGGSIRGDKEPLREPPEGALGLSLDCEHCEEEIVVYYLDAGEQAQCGECGQRTPVPRAASTTDKPSTLAKAYGYADADPRGLRTLPKPAARPDDKERLPQTVNGDEQRAEEAKKRLPRKATEH